MMSLEHYNTLYLIKMKMELEWIWFFADEEENLYTTKANRRTSTALYDTRNRRPKVTVRRRMSYSYGDYG